MSKDAYFEIVCRFFHTSLTVLMGVMQYPRLVSETSVEYVNIYLRVNRFMKNVQKRLLNICHSYLESINSSNFKENRDRFCKNVIFI